MLKFFLIAIGLLAALLLAGALYVYWQYKSLTKYNELLGKPTTTLHQLAKEGELKALENYLNSDNFDRQKIDERDGNGATPLAYAIGRDQDSIEAVKLLVNAGADLQLQPGEGMFGEFSGSPLTVAIKQLNLPVIRFLVEQGVDLHEVTKEGYGSFITLAYASHERPLESLFPIIDYFIEQKVNIYQKSKYNESAINTFYRFNHLDVLAYLKNKAIDLSELKLSELMQAILFADENIVETKLKGYQQKGTLAVELAHRAHWSYTPLILAVLHGSVKKVSLLLDSGADIKVQGRFKQTLPFYAINSNNPTMLAWLLDQHQFDLHVKNEHGYGLLDEVVTNDRVAAAKTLLAKKLDVNNENENGFSVLYDANSAQMAELLLSHGANPKDLTNETKRLLLGMPAEPTDEYTLLSNEDYLAGRYVEYGEDNPTLINDKFKLAMIKSGASPWDVTKLFDPERDIYEGKPIWNVQRFGQSFTRLPDGRVIEIGGEHEDYYDPDFQIYNDVIAHDDKGNIELYAYPKKIFPPTDFHSATLVGDKIYIIGSLGYETKPDITPVYTLDINNYHIEKIETSGDNPGWIHKHQAVLTDENTIQIFGGQISDCDECESKKNNNNYYFDLKTRTWSKGNSP